MKLVKFSPFIIAVIALAVLSVIWFIPDNLGIVDSSEVNNFRQSIGGIANLIYVGITIWLVIVTRRMAQDALNGQRANDRPQLRAEFYLSEIKPKLDSHGSIVSSREFDYNEQRTGTGLFLILKNLRGGGRAIDVTLSIEIKAHTNEGPVDIQRSFSSDYLLTGETLAIYLHNFQSPNQSTHRLDLKICTVTYSTPFGIESGDAVNSIDLTNRHAIFVTGTQISAFKFEKGLEPKFAP
jgi:hypothetical protein